MWSWLVRDLNLSESMRNSTVIEIGSRSQRTLASAVDVPGIGLITGARVNLRFCPASADAGLSFYRVDQRRPEPIPAIADMVTGTSRRTTLGRGAHSVTLVEHALAALNGMRIDNCRIELDGPEPPGLDGSASRFVEALALAGIVVQSARRGIWTVEQPLVIRHGNASIGFYPAQDDQLRLSYLLDYGPGAPIAPQAYTESVTPDSFQHRIAFARTFVLEEEAAGLQQQGVGRHLTAGELLVFGKHGLIENRLRYANEPARHKVLDLIGDLALSGLQLAGRVVAYRSGHPLNVELARTLSQMVGRNGNHTPLRLAA